MSATGFAGSRLLRLAGLAWRVEWEGGDHLEVARRASPRGNVIFAFWHSSLLELAYTHRERDIQVLVSQHRDGELIARILAHLGYGLVRGSSRRGGIEALFRLATLLESGLDVAVTVDGPVGPRHRVHPGVVLLARRTGRPIVPVVTSETRGGRLPTWDALRLPLPGARVRVRYCEHLAVAPELSQDRVAFVQERLESVMRQRTLEEEARHGRRFALDDVQDKRSFWERASERESPALLLRGVARLHAGARVVERALRPRPAGAGGRPWVIGIGNLEAGGTGKTPCIVELAALLAAHGLGVAVLTRGHRGALGRRRPEDARAAALERASDETRLLLRRLPPEIMLLVARDKRAGLAVLRRRGGLDVVLVDDAFQTAGLAVDRHLVLLDWERPFGNGYLLPAGRLREPPGALARADAVLLTRARPGALPSHPGPALPGDRIFLAEERSEAIRTPTGEVVPPERLRGVGVALLSGLGRPQAFERLAGEIASRHGLRIRRAVRIGDHAPLEPALRALAGRLEALGCRYVLTTEKDLARLPPGSTWNEPLLVVEQRLEIPDRSRLLETLVPDYWSAKFAKLTDSDALR